MCSVARATFVNSLYARQKLISTKLSKCSHRLIITFQFLRATAGTAIARLSHRNSVRLSVCHTGGSGKNGAS